MNNVYYTYNLVRNTYYGCLVEPLMQNLKDYPSLKDHFDKKIKIKNNTLQIAR